LALVTGLHLRSQTDTLGGAVSLALGEGSQVLLAVGKEQVEGGSGSCR
jgi:hypothetical protein